MKDAKYYLRIREERRRLGLTQEQLAEALSLTRQTVVFYENGRSLPDMAALDAMGRLGMDVGYLLNGQQDAELASHSFDWELHERIIKGIDQWANERDVHIPPEKCAILIRLLYEKFSETREVDGSMMDQVLRLVA